MGLPQGLRGRCLLLGATFCLELEKDETLTSWMTSWTYRISKRCNRSRMTLEAVNAQSSLTSKG